MRGFCLYRTGLQETRRLAESDPSVQAGRMAVEIMTWWTRPGPLSTATREPAEPASGQEE
jgi:hypothetical protein